MCGNNKGILASQDSIYLAFKTQVDKQLAMKVKAVELIMIRGKEHILLLLNSIWYDVDIYC